MTAEEAVLVQRLESCQFWEVGNYMGSPGASAQLEKKLLMPLEEFTERSEKKAKREPESSEEEKEPHWTDAKGGP